MPTKNKPGLGRRGSVMWELGIAIGVLAFWFALQVWILPKMGVST